MACIAKKINKSASFMLKIPIKVCLKEGIKYMVQGMLDRISGIAKVPVKTECCTWMVAVPTCTLGAAASNFLIGACFAK